MRLLAFSLALAASVAGDCVPQLIRISSSDGNDAACANSDQSPCKSISAALQKLKQIKQPCAVLQLAADSYTGALNRGFEIEDVGDEGYAGSWVLTGPVVQSDMEANAVIDLQGAAGFMMFTQNARTKVTLSNLVIQGGVGKYASTGPTHGGAVYVTQGAWDIHFASVWFANNSAAESNGGAVAVYSDQIGATNSISNCTFTGNEAFAGGGLFIDSQTTATSVVTSTFSHNTGKEVGGAAAIIGSHPLQELTVTNNVAYFEGGGLWLSDRLSSALVKLLTVTGNKAYTNGGGIFEGKSTVIYEHCVVANNNAGDSGGGMFFAGSSSSFNDVEITGNIANVGGGVFLADFKYDAESHFDNFTVYQNTARFRAGGVACAQGEGLEPGKGFFDAKIVKTNVAKGRGNQQFDNFLCEAACVQVVGALRSCVCPAPHQCLYSATPSSPSSAKPPADNTATIVLLSIFIPLLVILIIGGAYVFYIKSRQSTSYVPLK